MNKIETQEMISALADGQLHGEAFARGVEAAAADPQAREAWLTYHLIGDVLRSADLAAGAPAAAFMDRLSARLAQEPAPARPQVAAPSAPGPRRAAVNDGNFRWKMVAGFASLAAVAAVGWTLVSSAGAPVTPQLAAAPASAPRPDAAQAATVATGTERGVMIRDPRLDELMAAHRQFGGANALQMPAGFLRNATFEGPAR
ncbi:MAG TPA: sigma-E factor negative regulatory protein [Ramlibacter sp.]|nr:sigma-E factor negative regulatory protein [Ramlibacter sp.]